MTVATSDHEQIERLLYEYAFCLDGGDFNGFARLFAKGTWLGNDGHDAVLAWLESNIHLYESVPLTQHVVTNVVIDVAGSTATARSYLTVVQRTPGADRIEVITTVDYRDRFARDADGWHFSERIPARRQIGDNSRHRVATAAGGITPELSQADRSNLRDLVDRYALAADRRDGDAIAALFSPGGALLIHNGADPDAAPIEVRDTAESIAAGPKRLDRYRLTSHFLGQHVVDAVGDGARGTTYCIAHHLYAEGSVDKTFVVHLRYLDDYVRVGQAWRFGRRRLFYDFVEHRVVGGALL